MSDPTSAAVRLGQRKVLARMLRAIIRRRLTAPALFVLESAKPLSFLAAQGLIVLEPLISTVLPRAEYDLFTEAIADRTNLEWMIQQLEAVEGRPRRRAKRATAG